MSSVTDLPPAALIISVMNAPRPAVISGLTVTITSTPGLLFPSACLQPGAFARAEAANQARSLTLSSKNTADGRDIPVDVIQVRGAKRMTGIFRRSRAAMVSLPLNAGSVSTTSRCSATIRSNEGFTMPPTLGFSCAACGG